MTDPNSLHVFRNEFGARVSLAIDHLPEEWVRITLQEPAPAPARTLLLTALELGVLTRALNTQPEPRR